VKRECVETLVREIVITTEVIDGQAKPVPVITYVFEPITTRMDAPAGTPGIASVPVPAPRNRSAAIRGASAALCSTASISTSTCHACRTRS
jgi:hypothetical protein